MRTRPLVVSTRLDYGQRSRLQRSAVEITKRTGQPTSISELLRSAADAIGRRRFDTAALAVGIRALNDDTPATEKDRVELCKFLGLPADATDAEIQTAVQAYLVSAEPPAPAGATGGNADAPPPASAFRRELTKAELAYITKHKITPEQFAARKRAAVKRK
jgi:hypothetical protein